MEDTSTDAANTIRCILFQWHEDAAPVSSDILSVATSPFSMNNQTDNSKYTILYSQMFHLGRSGPQALGNKRYFDYSKKLMKTHYSGAGATAVEKGGLYYLVLSDSQFPTHPEGSLYIKLRFAEL